MEQVSEMAISAGLGGGRPPAAWARIRPGVFDQSEQVPQKRGRGRCEEHADQTEQGITDEEGDDDCGRVQL